MNTRPLTKTETYRLRKINEAGIESSLLFITETGLKKSILDANAPLRKLFLERKFHDFSSQAQGPAAKAMKAARFFTQGGSEEISVSLYRPKTKNGDPRIWPYNLTKYAKPDSVLALFIEDGALNIVNLSEDCETNLSETTELDDYLSYKNSHYDFYAQKLLGELRHLADTGPLEAIGTGSTAIGRTIETALGINMNSNPDPDYLGIELKSKRSASKTRGTLFARVPNWKISNLKSFNEFLDNYGYLRNGILTLNCTVSAKAPNPQGLFLNVDEFKEQLQEKFSSSKLNEADVCIWPLPTLHESLQKKHRETFWINAEERLICGKTHFILNSIKHTRRPSNIQFNRLLDIGTITVDHLIKRIDSGRAHERGPLFKIKQSGISELFLGEPKEYLLR